MQANQGQGVPVSQNDYTGGYDPERAADQVTSPIKTELADPADVPSTDKDMQSSFAA